MSQRQLKQPSFLGEMALWLVAGMFLSLLSLAATSSGKLLFGWSEGEWIATSLIAGALSLTWGSWAALLWTRSRSLKTLMLTVMLIPGLLMVAGGLWAFVALPENRWIWRWGWLIIAGHGVGAVAIALMVGGRKVLASAQALEVRARQLAVGWTLYPIAVVGASLAVLVVAMALMPDLFEGGMTLAETLARWTVPAQAMVLLSTAVPAAAHKLCDRLAQAGQSP